MTVYQLVQHLTRLINEGEDKSPVMFNIEGQDPIAIEGGIVAQRKGAGRSAVVLLTPIKLDKVGGF